MGLRARYAFVGIFLGAYWAAFVVVAYYIPLGIAAGEWTIFGLQPWSAPYICFVPCFLTFGLTAFLYSQKPNTVNATPHGMTSPSIELTSGAIVLAGASPVERN